MKLLYDLASYSLFLTQQGRRAADRKQPLTAEALFGQLISNLHRGFTART